ncbi:hypothetical protein CLI64_29775 (plasmid) [Nostoc sp. CENA543]|uniref:hypothetical protein n=1 Tax=Nostoc sp. CENA543 TaxID=1869241 RepID=UPI000CA27716|nr:hypothetical protein [Nostoc sp. CENA543]AUT04629.1 hypothetical protein CLI64_29775 [Nostoc sp. CENA543]
MPQFNEYFLNKIAKLPPDISALVDKYPHEIMNVIYAWDDEPFPDNYIPETMDIYYGMSETVNVSVVNGVLRKYNVPKFNTNPPSVTVWFDGSIVYIEIEGKEVLNKLGGASLPQVTIDTSTFIDMLTGVKS